MSRFDSIQDRALQLAGQLGDGIRHVPGHAQKWFKAGVAVGAARAGGKAVVRTPRQHPVISATAAAAVMAAAAGLAVYAYRRRKQVEAGEAIEGSSRRVQARRTTGAPRRTAARREPATHGGDEAV